jgi:hypothetical protein
MNLVSTEKPIHRPIIPATPAKTGGAGTGNLNAAKTTPHPKPVSVDSNTSFIDIPFLLILYSGLSIHQQSLFLLRIFFLTQVHSLVYGKNRIPRMLDLRMT